ncbi:hypothetical protein [Paenibacillus rhizoplanae]
MKGIMTTGLASPSTFEVRQPLNASNIAFFTKLVLLSKRLGNIIYMFVRINTLVLKSENGRGTFVSKVVLLISSVVVGVLIMISPGFITGHTFGSTQYQGSLYIAEFVVRSLALIIGLMVIYDGIKSFFKRLENI